MPKISIITPSHNPKYLGELWESIKNQTFTDFEWVIVANNGAKIEHKDFGMDVRVNIINCPFESSSVGFLKKYGFLLAKGEILAEVDHDDLITPDCLEEVVKAFDDKEIGFAYSDNAKLQDNFKPYNKDFGWISEPFEWQDKTLTRMKSFEPTSHSFAFIWYAPDHIRAWRASVYKSLKGHNASLEVLDDQDLMIRTYLATKIKFIDKCLYIYRITGDNTWLARNAKIQSGTVELYHKYAYQLAEREAELSQTLKIDLGGAFGKPDGYSSLDLKNGDIEADLNKKWPLEDNSVGVIRAHDIFEHLVDKQFVMSECFRVLKDGGWLMVQVPSTDGRGAFQDPTHINYWNSNCFWYWTRAEQAKYIYNDKIKFQEFRLGEIFPNAYCKENNIPYAVAYLSAVKSDKRRPHLKKI